MNMMNSRRMKKMVLQVVKVPRKQVFRVQKHNKSKALEEHSLITADQPLSDAQLKTKNHHPIIPKGFVAVYVGPHHRRFLIPTRFLSVPDFKPLMDRAAEEFGYEQQGGLRIPCGEDDFQKLLAACKFNSNSDSKSSSTYIRAHYYYTTPI